MASPDWAQKKTSFLQRYIGAIDTLLRAVDSLESLEHEWDANGFATGAQPPEHNITDDDCAICPWVSALSLNQSVGAVHTVNDTLAMNRGYLEAVRA